MQLSPKFTPPVYNPSIHLNRERIHSFFSENINKDIMIEARAGQGKSMAIAQYLRHSDVRYAWFQTGSEDCDAILFVYSFYHCLKASIEGYYSDQFEILLTGQELFLSNIADYAALLSEALANLNKDRIVIILDDIHQMIESPVSSLFLQALIRSKPTCATLILLSRPTENLKFNAFLKMHDFQYAGNDLLSMARLEIASLFNDVLKRPVSIADVDSIHSSTEGWTMGVVAKSFLNASSVLQGQIDSYVLTKAETLNAYFENEIFSGIKETLLNALSRLSLLEEIPAGLAPTLTGNKEIVKELDLLVNNNFFLKNTGGDDPIFEFHHFFREQLMQHSEKNLDHIQKKETFIKAAKWYLDNNRIERSLIYFIKAGEFDEAHTILAEEGFKLFSQNRIITLQSMFSEIPECEIKHYAWFSFYYGLIMMDMAPAKAKEYFSMAESLFVKESNELGELIVITQIIRFHLLIDVRFVAGKLYLKRMVTLYEKTSDSLPVFIKINSTIVLSMAESMVNRNMIKAEAYNNIAMKLAQEYNLENSEISARINQLCIYLFNVDLETARSKLEYLYRSFFSVRVDGINKMMIQLIILNLFFLENDEDSYLFYKKNLEKKIGKELLEQSLLYPFLIIFESSMAIGKGKVTSAIELLKKGIKQFSGDTSKIHFTSQFYHDMTFISGMTGNAKEVNYFGERALKLRNQAGGASFIMLCNLIVGAAHVQLGEYETGESYIETAISMSKDFDEFYIRTAASFHRAYLRLTTGRKQEALDDILFAVKTMKEKKYKSFLSWYPDVVQFVLAEAIKNNIEPVYVKQLAMTSMGVSFDVSDNIIPVLEFKTLGDVSIRINGKEVLNSANFTKGQTEILAVLVTSPNKKVRINTIQKMLWPGSSLKSRKDRTRLNTSLSRLRGVFNKALKPHNSGNYLMNTDDHLSLNNSIFDYDQCINHAEKGLIFASKNQFWQASVEFRKALILWEDEFLPGIIMDTGNTDFAEYHLEIQCLKCADAWCDIILSGIGYDDEDMQLIERICMAKIESCNFTPKLIRIYKQVNKHVNALRIEKKYQLFSAGHDSGLS